MKRQRLTKRQQALVAQWVRLAYLLANQWARRFPGSDPEALAGSAMLALCRAARAFKPELGVKFSTFANMCINQELRRETGRQEADGFGALGNRISDGRSKRDAAPARCDPDGWQDVVSGREIEAGDELVRQETVGRVRQALSRLPLDLALVAWLAATGEGAAEIARTFGYHRKDIKTLRSKAHAALRAELAGMEAE